MEDNETHFKNYKADVIDFNTSFDLSLKHFPQIDILIIY